MPKKLRSLTSVRVASLAALDKNAGRAAEGMPLPPPTQPARRALPQAFTVRRPVLVKRVTSFVHRPRGK